MSVDPIAEDYPQLSSYNYAGNKPITSPDIEGLQGTEDSSGPSQAPDSGNAEFDRQANSALETFGTQDGHSVDIIHNIGESGDLESGSISVNFPNGKSEVLNYSKETGFTEKDGNPASGIAGMSLSISAQSSYNSLLRDHYRAGIKSKSSDAVEKIRQSRNLDLQREIAKDASEFRDNSRTAAQNKQTPLGKTVSKTIESSKSKKSFDQRVAEQGGHKSSTYEKIAENSGKSRTGANRLAKFGKGLGAATFILSGILGYNRWQNAPAEQKNQVIAEEVMSFVVSTVFSIVATAATVALLGNPVGLIAVGGIFAVGLVAGYLGGVLGAEMGKQMVPSESPQMGQRGVSFKL